MYILALYHLKGGVGKTAAAVNLAYAASRQGLSTLLIDMDPQGAVSFYLQVKPRKKHSAKRLLNPDRSLIPSIRSTAYPNLDVLPSNLSYRKVNTALARKKKSRSRLRKALQKGLPESDNPYQIAVIDSPPNIGMEAENIFTLADRILVPLIPTPLSLAAFGKILEFFRKKDYSPDRLRAFYSMVDRRKKIHKTLTAAPPETVAPYLYPAPVPYASAVEQMGIHQAPLLATHPHTPPARAYQALWEMIAEEDLDGDSDWRNRIYGGSRLPASRK